MLFCVMNALGELAVAFPVSGGFATYASRFMDPAWGFSMGWNYALQWIICLPLEIVAASLTIGYWRPDLDPAIFVSVFLVLIVAINMCGTEAYANAEVAFSFVKCVAIIGFIIFGLAVDLGASQSTGYIGARYWLNPGPFNNGFKGLCSVMVNAAFAFSGTELIGLTAAETDNPRKTLPAAIKQVFWRICLFYLGSLTVVGLILPFDFPGLVPSDESKADGHSPNASPYVLAVVNAGVTALPAIMNAAILLAVISVANSSVFGGSRTLVGLAEQAQAPKIFAYVDRKGRPLAALGATLSVGLLAYLACMSDRGANIFQWLLAFSGLSAVFTWLSICVCHIRFRTAWRKRGHSTDELSFISRTDVWGSYFGVAANVFILGAQFWVAVRPIGYESYTPSEIAQEFFQAYLCVPLMIIMYVVWKVLKRSKIMRSHTIDLQTGRSQFDEEKLMAEEKAERETWGPFKRVWRFLC